MIRPSTMGNCAGCPCAQASSMGSLTDTLSTINADLTANATDWKTWALVAAAALALYFILQSTPRRQERSVKVRAAKAKYKGELARIHEEYR